MRNKCEHTNPIRNGWGSCLDCKKENYSSDKRSRYMRTVWRFKRYGITQEIFEGLLNAQNGQCAICHTDVPGGRYGEWHIDHCHSTGRVRGLLCSSCNMALGQFKDSPELLRRALEYLEDADERVESF